MLALPLGILCGFLAFELTAPLRDQGNPKNSLFVTLWDDMYLHVHHWMYCLALMFPLSLVHRALLGVCLGGVLHGLAFKDRFEVVRHFQVPPKGLFVF